MFCAFESKMVFLNRNAQQNETILWGEIDKFYYIKICKRSLIRKSSVSKTKIEFTLEENTLTMAWLSILKSQAMEKKINEAY